MTDWENRRDEAANIFSVLKTARRAFRVGSSWARQETIREANEILGKALKLILKTPAISDTEIRINKCAFEALEAWKKATE